MNKIPVDIAGRVISTWNGASRFPRFILTGVINTIFGYSCFAIFLYIGIHYSIALMLSTICGVIFNFNSIGILVFQSCDQKRIYKFVLVYFLVYIVNVSLLKVLHDLGLDPYYGGAVLILPMALLAFSLNKRYVFS
jgi:putative flippase GtrA